jgi:hypothetical protein
MERTIGNLGLEVRQPSNPYANLAQRGLLRSQVNALKAMIPDLEDENPGLPHGAVDIGDGYALLRKKDTTSRKVQEPDANAIRVYLHTLDGNGVDQWDGMVTKWGRLRLPNGQIARSSWVEENQKRTPRRARNVTVM